MIYIVTGTQRSGTSMMMKCLQAGGMQAYFNEEREKELRAKHPETNKDGYFEPTLEEMNEIDFPLAAQDMVVKFHAPWKLLGTIAPAQYRIILMYRDPREIVWSLGQFHKGFVVSGDIAIYNRYYDYMAKAMNLVANRKDVISIHRIDYRSFLQYPVEILKKLNWPINADQAASVVNPAVCKTPQFGFPFSGDIAKDMKLDTMSINEAIIQKKIKAPEEIVEAAKKGAEIGMQMS